MDNFSKVSFITVNTFDGCNYWIEDILHTKNVKQLEDLVKRLNKKFNPNQLEYLPFFSVNTVPTCSLGRQVINDAMRREGY